MPPEPDPVAATRNDLAAALRELRGALGLSGERAAARALMTQSKISRIETGRSLPSVADVEQLLRAYDADGSTTDRIMALARAATREYRSVRTDVRRGVEHRQTDLAGLERGAGLVRHFLPAVPTGLLHTRAYAEATLRALGTVPPGTVERVVDGKMARQRALDDPQREFVFLMTETAIRARVAPPGVMAGQCVHLAELAARGRPRILLVPFAARWPVMAMNTFVIYDDRIVTVEVFSGEVVLHDPQDVAYHTGVFEAFAEQALTGADAAAFLRVAAAEYQATARFMQLPD
jgi:transcriptional regulator with XRE-family HTH domain